MCIFLFREWPVLGELRSAPSFPPITTAQSQVSPLAPNGSSEFRLVMQMWLKTCDLLFGNKLFLIIIKKNSVLKVSESGVHRPHVAGIHGRSNDGSYSLVLAGGYEDDVVSFVPNPSPWKLFSILCINIYNTCVFRMMVMNSLTLVRGAEIFLATKGQPSSHVIKPLLT